MILKNKKLPFHPSEWAKVFYRKSAVWILLITIAGCSPSPELEWHQEQSYRWADIPSPSGSSDHYGFELQSSSQTGIAFDNTMTEEALAGSEYWSQNSFTQVLGAEEEVEQIEVTWFDGRRQTIEVTEGNKDYVISHPDTGKSIAQ